MTPDSTIRVVTRVAAVALLLLLGMAVLTLASPLVWLLFGPVAAVVYPLTVRRGNPAFNVIKGISVSAAALLLAAMLAFAEPGDPGIWAHVVVLVFGLNILEATISDGVRKRWLNVVAGVLLLVSLPPASGISVGARLVVYPIDSLWLVAYTSWNLAFCAGRSPEIANAHTGVLLAPLLVDLALPGTWAHARAYTLGLHQLVASASPRAAELMRWKGAQDRVRRLHAPLAAASVLAWLARAVLT